MQIARIDRLFALATLALVCLAAPAFAQSAMFASTGAQTTHPGAIGTVDEGTAAFSLIGATGRPAVAGLAFDSLGNLYGTYCDNSLPGDPCWLFTIDPATGAEIAEIGQLSLAGGGGNDPWVSDLAFQPGTDTLYGIDYYNGVVTIDTATAVATLVGVPPFGNGQGGGIAFTPDGRLYLTQATTSTEFWELSPVDASVLNTIPFSAGALDIAGLGARPSDGLLFANERRARGGRLLTLDSATGAVTEIGTPSEFLADCDFQPRAITILEIPALPGGLPALVTMALLLFCSAFWALRRRPRAE